MTWTGRGLIDEVTSGLRNVWSDCPVRVVCSSIKSYASTCLDPRCLPLPAPGTTGQLLPVPRKLVELFRVSIGRKAVQEAPQSLVQFLGLLVLALGIGALDHLEEDD